MFSGRFDHAIDEKGRVSIPARFREVLQREGHDRLFITNFFYTRERCLELYPPREWAGLARDVTFSARRDHFQLWDRQVLERVLRATEEEVQDPAFFEKLNL